MTTPATFTAPRRAERLPVTLVTGFLGSGKTTLINHILSNRVGAKAAVLVNELGEIGIDSELITGAEAGMIELSNGCICCSTNNDLLDGLVRVLARPDPVDHLLVETSGVADPLPIAQTFLRPEFREALRLDSVVAVADAEQLGLDLFNSAAVHSQLRHADAILVNKCDRVGDDELATVERKIRAANAEARMVRTTRSAVPLPIILDADLFRPRGADHVHRHAHLDADGFVSLSFESDRPFSALRFQEFLDNRPPGLFRGKGFLWLSESGKRHVFHLVGGRFTLEEDRRPSAANRLVLIGQRLDIADLRARLARCVVD